MTTIYRTILLSLLGLLLGACGKASPSIALDRMSLPKALVEVSGLTVGVDQSLYAISDELGQIYRIQFDRAQVDKGVSFGTPPVKQDFEGLTWVDDTFYAITSRGVIYQQAMGVPGETLKIKTGLAKQCEFEGLAADPAEPLLWLLCKTPLSKRLEKRLTIYAWNRQTQKLQKDSTISVKYKSLKLSKNFAPSGLTLSADGQIFLLVAAKQKSFVYLAKNGELIRAGLLPDQRGHEQAEGVVLVGEVVYVADEGRHGRASITRYPHGF